jgi:hypothetical protein
LNFDQSDSTSDGDAFRQRGEFATLAEKFFLVLEILRSHASDEKPPTPHTPIKLPR